MIKQQLNKVADQTETILDDVFWSHYDNLDDNPSKQPTVAVVTETWYPDINGVSHSIGKIVHHLLNLGVNVQLFGVKNDLLDETELDPRLEYFACRGSKLPFYKEVSFGIFNSKQLRIQWRKDPPDIIQIVTEGPLGYSAMKTAKRLNIPVISDYHTNFQLYSKNYHLGWLEKIVSGYLRYLHNHTYMTVVPTKELQKQLQYQKYNNVKIMTRGIDTAVFNPNHRSEKLRKTWGVSNSDPVILYVGRIAAEKNIALAIKAFQATHEQNPNSKFVLVGDGPLRKQLEQKHPELIFCGMQTGKALSEHYASADIFLAPSVTETFGNTILEAMASGLAVVTYNYAAALEHMENGVTGIKVPFDNEQEFIKQAIELSQDDALIECLRTNAHLRVQNLSWNDVSKQLLRLMNQIIDQHNLSKNGA